MHMGNLGEEMRWFFVAALSVQMLFASPEEEGALKIQVLSHLPTIDGWCSNEKAVHFIDLIFQEKPKVWVEIGVFGGSSLFPVLSTFKYLGEGKAYAIDPWDKFETIRYFDPMLEEVDLNWWGNLNMNHIYQSFLKMLGHFQLQPYCVVLRKTAEKAVLELPEIDVLYLDGNHAEFPSLQDAQNYLPKVRKGGYIWFNDSHWVQRQAAIEWLLLSCDVVKVIENGNCILLRKR